ncbi:hypothetical protein PFISCL1PPCAC_6743, partial [Pristionchus fissidentatus]
LSFSSFNNTTFNKKKNNILFLQQLHGVSIVEDEVNDDSTSESEEEEMEGLPIVEKVLLKEGVDPFALLKKIPVDSETSEMLDQRTRAEKIKRLRVLRKKLLPLCDKAMLAATTNDLIRASRPQWCDICLLKLTSAKQLILHFCCKRHIKMLHKLNNRFKNHSCTLHLQSYWPNLIKKSIFFGMLYIH